MLRFFFKRLHISLLHSKTHLGFTQNHFITFTSLSTHLNSDTNRNSRKDRNFITSYLLNPTGFSPDTAKTISELLGLKKLRQPLQVISVLRNYGFNDTNITRMLTKNLNIISFSPHRIILPKLEFLVSTGIGSNDVVRFVSSHPAFLYSSLKDYIVPVHSLLETLFPCEMKLAKAWSLVQLCRNSKHKILNNLPVNVSMLEGLGIPHRIILYFISRAPCFLCAEPDKFSEFVGKAIEIEVCTKKFKFVEAVIVMAMSNKTWERRMDIYRQQELSDDEIWSAFKRYPRIMLCSEKKIVKTVEFLVNKMGWKPADIAKFPSVVYPSLEKTIIPRCSVVSVLMSKGLVKEEINLCSVLHATKSRFFESFVVKYQEEIPQLLSISKGEMSISKLGYGFPGEKEYVGQKARKSLS